MVTTRPESDTLSLHDALPISRGDRPAAGGGRGAGSRDRPAPEAPGERPAHGPGPRRRRALPALGRGGAVAAPASRADLDRKSTRLNSSHPSISYAVSCLKKQK